MSDQGSSGDKGDRLRLQIMTWGGSVILGIAMIGLLVIWLRGFSEAWGPELIKDHFAAVIGLPTAALGASCVIIAFRQTEGPIEFEVLTFKLKGAAGPVVLWTLCFFVIAAAIKLLWSN